MADHLPSVCSGCEKRDACCADGKPPEPGEVAGAKLAALAVAFFLLPIAAAIAAGALVGRERSILVGSVTLAGALIVAAAVSAWAHRRRSNVKS